MKEYEDTISKMLAEMEHKSKAWNSEKARLEAERKQAQDDLAGAELAFSDLHRKYERAKEAIVGLKSNEEALRKSNADFQLSLEKANINYQKLKAHAEAQLEK
jgi:chromosome segregation ATPase